MSGLRTRSKLRRQRLVLDAAERLFREHGYARTTLEEIASSAEVSIGTIYTYFGSKGGVMRALMRPVIDEMKARGEAVLANPPKRAVDAIAALYDAWRFTDDWKHVNLLNAFDPRTRSGDAQLEKVSAEFEQFIEAQLGEMLRRLRKAGRLDRRVTIEDAVFILYNLLLSHFEAHLLAAGGRSYEEILVDMHRRLRLVFRAWTAAART